MYAIRSYYGSGDHAIAWHFLFLHPEIDTIVFDIGVELFEAAFVEKDLEPFARRQLALGVLGVDPLLPATHDGGSTATFHFSDA